MAMSGTPVLILASQSPRRLSLLSQIGIIPDYVSPADINEDPIEGEVPREHALRLSQEKAAKVAGSNPDKIILAADTVVGVGRRILPKAETIDEARYCLDLLSGRGHRVFTGVAVIKADGDMLSRVVETRLTMKRLSKPELEDYLASGEWQGKAGGYGIQGSAEGYISKLIGSYSNVVGLPLFETRNLLQGAGYLR
ncbi:Maf family protein [Hellea balneolensis]|uniref:Maf family protein n=1 Tax=Hellea balneolensis TaxID=287478 RepID=UPI000555DBBA